MIRMIYELNGIYMQVSVERFLIRLSDEVRGDIFVLANDHVQV